MSRRILKDCAIVAGALAVFLVFTVPLMLINWTSDTSVKRRDNK